MQSLIQSVKGIYFTGFAIIFNASRIKNISYKAGGATSFLSAIEWFVLLGIVGYVDMFLNKKILDSYSRAGVLFSFFVLFLINDYILRVRGHGIAFAHEFGKLEKSKRVLLTVRFVITALVAVTFFICSAIAHRHFIAAK